MPPLALALALVAAAACPAGQEVACAAVAAGLAVRGGHAEVAAVRAASGGACAADAAEALRPVVGSGEVALRLTGARADGARCEGFAWARVRVLAPALVLTRTVAAGEPLAAAVTPADAEVRTGQAPPLSALPEGAR